MKKYGIIVACKNEIITLLNSKYKLVKSFENEVYPTYVYEIASKEVYISLSGIGETSSSACTQYMITKYGINFIFNYGACGSLTRNLNLTSVVFVDSIIDIGFDTSLLDNCKKHSHIELGFEDPVMYINQNLVNLAKNKFPNVEKVRCASNNLFVDSRIEKEEINKTYNAQICEMEASGIYLTCLKNKVDCFFIKSVSDTVTGGKEEYEKFATSAAQKALEILVEILKDF